MWIRNKKNWPRIDEPKKGEYANEIQDLKVIYVLCSIYDKEELKNIYGDEIVDYKKIFDTIKSEDDIWNTSSELLKLYLQRKEIQIHWDLQTFSDF